MNDILSDIDAAVYQEAWEYLDVEDPSLADKIKKAVAAGCLPEEIRSRYLRTAGDSRSAKAKRVENAARFLWAEKVK